MTLAAQYPGFPYKFLSIGAVDTAANALTISRADLTAATINDEGTTITAGGVTVTAVNIAETAAVAVNDSPNELSRTASSAEAVRRIRGRSPWECTIYGWVSAEFVTNILNGDRSRLFVIFIQREFSSQRLCAICSMGPVTEPRTEDDGDLEIEVTFWNFGHKHPQWAATS